MTGVVVILCALACWCAWIEVRMSRTMDLVLEIARLILRAMRTGGG